MSRPVRRDQSSALLIDLVTNTLDPGYAAAAKRRAGARTRPSDRVALVVGCVLVGFLVVVAYIAAHRAAPDEAKIHADLVARVRAAESADNKLDATAQQLSSRVNTLRNQALPSSGALRDELQREQLAAGATAARGSGLQVRLVDPPAVSSTPTPGRKGTTPITATRVLTDRDVRSVVNQLWLNGAEAIAVNGVRLTPTSAIRFAGEAVLVDFRPISSPYVIQAIGDPAALDTGFAASAVASRYQTLAAADGIGFSFDEQKSLDLPAAAAIAPRYASAANSSPTSTSTPSPTARPSGSPTPTSGSTR